MRVSVSSTIGLSVSGTIGVVALDLLGVVALDTIGDAALERLVTLGGIDVDTVPGRVSFGVSVRIL